MNELAKIESISLRISNHIHKVINPQMDLDENPQKKFEERHLESFKELLLLDFEETILIFGLNPSSSDIDNIGITKPCFLNYVSDDEYESYEDKERIKSLINSRGYTYNSYFKKPFEIFLELKNGYVPAWKNSNFLNYKRAQYNIPEEDEVFEFLMTRGSVSKKYILFTDLLQYRETTSKQVEQIINKNDDIKSDVLVLLECQLKFLKTKYVLVNNAFASHLIHAYIKDKLNDISENKYSTLEYNGIRFFFSSMITGVRAMDLFSFERLKNEIKNYIK